MDQTKRYPAQGVIVTTTVDNQDDGERLTERQAVQPDDHRRRTRRQTAAEVAEMQARLKGLEETPISVKVDPLLAYFEGEPPGYVDNMATRTLLMHFRYSAQVIVTTCPPGADRDLTLRDLLTARMHAIHAIAQRR